MIELNYTRFKALSAAYYRFVSGSETVDSSPNGNTLTAVNTPLQFTPKWGGAIGVTGGSTTTGYQITDGSDFQPTGSFSIAMWHKSTASLSNKYLFQSFSLNPNWAGFVFRIDLGKINLAIGKNTGTVSNTDFKTIFGGSSVNDGNWHFLCATYDGVNMRLYVDGVSDATAVACFAPVYAATNYVRLFLNNSSGTDGSTPTAIVDDVTFWNGKALSTGEQATIMTHEFINDPLFGDATNKAYYRFEEGALTTDSTTNAHTLTAVAFPAGLTKLFNGSVYVALTSNYTAVDGSTFQPTGNFSVGGWFKTSSTGIGLGIFQSQSQNTNLAGLRFNITTSNKITFISSKNTGTTINVDFKQITGGTTVTDGLWHFTVATWDGANLNLYLDGVTDSVAAAWANAPAYAATNYVRVGALNNTGADGSRFNGQLSNIFLLNGTALTAAQVSFLYTFVSPLPAHYSS